MAEERTLGLVRAEEPTEEEEPSKQELQRRLDETRDSISQTVAEIRENVSHQVQTVKENLDWREHFKRRPVVWSAGAMGVGFLVGYKLAGAVKGNGHDASAAEVTVAQSRSYAAQPVLGARRHAESEPEVEEERGPGLFERLTSTPAYGKLRSEAGSVGDAFVQELSNTAKLFVLPALMKSLRNFIGGHLPNADATTPQVSGSSSPKGESARTSAYQPKLETT